MVAIALRQNCPLGLSDEDYETTISGVGATWLHSCNALDDGGAPHASISKAAQASTRSREGALTEHRVDEDVLACIPAGEGLWIDHSVVERRDMRRRPHMHLRFMLRTCEHAKTGAKPSQFTSLRPTMAMSQLRREGLLAYRTWKPTGWWVNNSCISWGAWPTGPPDDRQLSLASYSADVGLDPDDWDLTRRAT